MYSSPRCKICRCENHPRPVERIVLRSRGITQEKADQLAHMDAEVMHVYNTGIIALRDQCIALTRKRNGFVPAVNLPAEVLVIIFEFACCPTYPDGERYHYDTIIDLDFWKDSDDSEYDYGRTRLPTPLCISRVCSVWRDIAMGASQLWNTIKLTIDYLNKHADKQFALLSHWLSNSGQRPLTVGLVMFEEREQWNGTEMYDDNIEVIDALVPYAHRLHTVELSGVPPTWESALIQIGNCTSILTRLTIHKSYEHDILDEVNFFAEALQLRDVALFGFNIWEVSLQWRKIERLVTDVLDDLDPLDPLESLRLCPRLRHYELEYSTSRISWPPPMSLTHTILETLDLGIDIKTDLAALLDPLTCPALRSFVLTFRDDVTYLPLVVSFFVRSACALETLHLCGLFTQDEDNLLACLQALPWLRDFSLKNISEPSWSRKQKLTGKTSQKIFDAMDPGRYDKAGKQMKQNQNHEDVSINERGNGQCLVPNLEKFLYEGDITFDRHALIKFLANRWNAQDPADERSILKLNSPVVRLRSAAFRIPFLPVEKADEDTLLRLRQEGMRIQFETV